MAEKKSTGPAITVNDELFALTEDGRTVKLFTGPESAVEAIAKQMNHLDYEASFKERGYKCRTRLYGVVRHRVGDPANFDPTEPPGPAP